MLGLGGSGAGRAAGMERGGRRRWGYGEGGNARMHCACGCGCDCDCEEGLGWRSVGGRGRWLGEF